MQRRIVEKDFHSLNKIPNFNFGWIKDQMLLYIRSKSGIGKNKIINAIELGCFFLLQNFDFIITTPTDTRTDNISSSTIYISLVIGIKNRHRKSNMIFNL